MDLVLTFIIAAAIGVLIGVLSGLLGIGGGMVMVPVFRLLFGMSPIMSTASSLFAIVPTSISGVISHVRHKTCIPALGIAAGIGGAITSVLGVWLANISPAWLIMVVAAAVAIWSSVQMLSKAIRMKPAKAEPKRDDEVPQADETAELTENTSSDTDKSEPAKANARTASTNPDAPIHLSPTQLVVGGCIGMMAGVVSGYVGVGGGFIMVPLMLSLVGITMRKASGTSLIAVMILAIPGVIEQGVFGNISYFAGIAIVVGSIPGAMLGAHLVRVIPERALRFIFGCFLIVVAILLIMNEFGILG